MSQDPKALDDLAAWIAAGWHDENGGIARNGEGWQASIDQELIDGEYWWVARIRYEKSVFVNGRTKDLVEAKTCVFERTRPEVLARHTPEWEAAWYARYRAKVLAQERRDAEYEARAAVDRVSWKTSRAWIRTPGRVTREEGRIATTILRGDDGWWRGMVFLDGRKSRGLSASRNADDLVEASWDFASPDARYCLLNVEERPDALESALDVLGLQEGEPLTRAKIEARYRSATRVERHEIGYRVALKWEHTSARAILLAEVDNWLDVAET